MYIYLITHELTFYFGSYPARIKEGFMGPCIKCTEKQQNWLSDSLNLIAETDSELFRAVIARYIEFYGVTLPFEDRLRVAKAFEM